MKQIKVIWQERNGERHETEYEEVKYIKTDKEENETYIIICGKEYISTFFFWEIVKIEL